KKAIIRYEPISATVLDAATYDRVLVYLIGDQQHSFMRFNREGEEFTQKLNELLNYHLIAIGYKDDTTYFHAVRDIAPGARTFSLALTPTAAMKGRINVLCRWQTETDLYNDIAFQRFALKDRKRQLKNLEVRALRERLYPVIFPCDTLVVRSVDEAMEVPEVDRIFRGQ
ncbi:MAG: hypothetical protein AAGB22_04055, partial [Bacteroidota bacterium]